MQRFTHVPASMLAGLPLGFLLELQPDAIFFLGEDPSPEQLAQFDLLFGQEGRFEPREGRGRNVLLVVLETVRGDHWADPRLTPRFHRWKRRGTYVPDAVAQYPATPLAYGAMFTAQPPSVLAQTPYWGRSRLFDGIRDRFDTLILSRPENRWFAHTAITDFFVPRDVEVNRHASGPEGLTHLRERIADLDGRSFFGWVHLYEPHDPYEPREPFVRGAGRHAAYRSEIAFVDHHLGEFMEWFFEQPIADDTLVVVIGDHGEGMGERILGRPYWGHHVHVHNVVSRIPAFFAGPGIPPDRTEAGLGVAQLDVMPTIYDHLGAPLPADFYPQGLSIHELLERRPERPLVTEAFSIRGKAFFDFVAEAQRAEDLDAVRARFQEISTSGQRYAPKIALQHGRYKVIYDRVLRRHWLYDVERDPGERTDLAASHPELLAEMVTRLEDWTKMQSLLVRRLDALHR